MAFTIMNNSSAMLALGETNKNNTALSKSLKKVSSGMRLNSAGDGASDYAISEKMKILIRSLQSNKDNIENAKTMLNVASEGVNQQIDIIKNIYEIAIKSSNGIYSDSDRRVMENEVQQLLTQFDDIANTTNFNGIYLLNRSTAFYADRVGNDKYIGESGDYSSYSIPYDIDYKFFYHGSEQRNTINNQFFPTPNYGLKTAAKSFSGKIGYSTPRYDKIPYDSQGNIYMWDSTGRRLSNIPPVGTSVSYYHFDEPSFYTADKWTGIIYQDYETGEIRIKPTGVITRACECSITLDYSRIPGAKGTGNIEDDFDDQSMSFFCTECYQAVSIHFTKALPLGTAKKYVTSKTGQYSNTWGTTFVVGISGASNYKEIEDATFDSIMAINGKNNDNSNSTNLTNSNVDVFGNAVHIIRLSKYTFKGKTIYQVTKTDVTLDLVAYEGRIGNIILTPKEDSNDNHNEQMTEDNDYPYGILPYDILHIQTGHIGSSFTNVKLYNTTLKALFPAVVENKGACVSSIEQSQKFMGIVEKALNYLLQINTSFGSQCSRFDTFGAIKDEQLDNTIRSQSIICDADMAKEMTQYTKASILSQTAQAILTQANKKSSDVLSLLE